MPVGSRITVKNAINALIIKSANDVATVVAENLGGSERRFALIMTHKARKIGMKKTIFEMPQDYLTARRCLQQGIWQL